MKLKFLSYTLFVLFAAFGSIETTWTSGLSGNSSSWPNNQANHSTSSQFRPFGRPPPFTNPGNTRDSDSWLTHIHNQGYPSNSSRPNRPSEWPGYRPGTNNGSWAPRPPQSGDGVRYNSTRPFSWPQNRPEENNRRWGSGPPRSSDGVNNNSSRLYPSLAYFQNGNSDYHGGQNNPRYK